MEVLEGKGSPEQNSVVIANAGMALFCGDQGGGIPLGLAKAKEALGLGRRSWLLKSC